MPGVMAAVLAIGSGAASAVGLDAFSAEVAVVDRGGAELGEAFELALRETLLANSGDKTLLNRDDVRHALTEPRRYVEQFRYRTPEPGTLISRDTPVTRRVLATGQATQLLSVRFDAARVQALIESESEDAPVDEVPEPQAPSSALLWMLIEDGERDVLVGGDAVVNVQRRLREIAGGAGFALAFPAAASLGIGGVGADELRLLGATGTDGVPSPSDVPTATSGAAAQETDTADAERLRGVLPAATRVDDTLVVAAHLRRLPLGGWQARWLNLGAGNDPAVSRRFRTDTLDAALRRGLASLAPALDAAVRFDDGESNAAAPDLDEGLVWIGALGSAADYATVVRFLDSVETVSLAYPKLVEDDGMLFAVVPREALRDVDRAVRSDPAFRRGAPRAAPDLAPLVRQAELTLDFVNR